MPVVLPLPKNGHQEDTKLHPDRIINNVTFFGDSAIPEGDAIYQSVWDAAQALASDGYTVVNGGGPGIMKAATDGAESVGGKTIAVYWQPKLAEFFEGKNLANKTDESQTESNYVMRTFGLIEKGDVFVVCKGGTGTISEFGLVWCLAKLYYGCHKPVVLYGDFWDGLIKAFQKAMYIDDVELGVLHRADTPEELLKLVKSFEEAFAHCKIEPQKEGDENAFRITGHSVTKVTYETYASEYHSSRVGKLVAQEQLEDFAKMVNPPAKVLDLGCGPGHDLTFLAKKYSAEGIEMVKRFADMATYENPGTEIICADITEHDIGNNKYKGIWARDSIHHIKEHDLDLVFKKVSNALVEGGIFYTIVREGEGEIYEKENKNYGKMERFYHLFSSTELISRAEKAGLKLVKIDHVQRSHKWLVGVFQK